MKKNLININRGGTKDMGILDLTNPLVLFAAILLYAFLFILGKEFKSTISTIRNNFNNNHNT